MKRLIILITLMSVFIGCTENKKEEEIVSKEFSEKKTYCFAHSLIDLPADFFPGDGTTASFATPGNVRPSQRVNLTVMSQNLHEEQFLSKVALRRAEILENAQPDLGALKGDRAVTKNSHIFNINVIEQSYETELHVFLEGNYLILTTDSYDGEFVAGERRLVDFLQKMKSSVDDADTGYCIGNIKISGKFSEESSNHRYLSKRFPDVSFSVDSNTYAPNERQNLLERVDGPESLLRKFNVKNHVMRKGDLHVASMEAQEWLSWVILGDGDDKKKQYGFALETMRPMPSPAQPRIHVEMDSGQPDAAGNQLGTSLSDADAVTIWDIASKSIRSRLPEAGR
jgi:hypothetical protein